MLPEQLNRQQGIQLLLILLIVTVIPVTVYLTQQQQDLRQRAAEESPVTPAFPPITPIPVYQQRIDAGANSDFADNVGHVWSADKSYTSGSFGYIGGTPYAGSNTMTNTVNGPLYATTRFGSSFEYRFTVPNGTYYITLKLAEVQPANCKVGARVINVSAEGNVMIVNNDIFTQAGCSTALDKTFTVAVNDGVLNLQFASTADAASVNAIGVVSTAVRLQP